ncbi:transcription factor Ouib [Drosophila santomea]|uniref:transcription factor Ouib n=1 Tax=Drosophila santomea TaxID=129105 RepID=UPI001953E6DE|nr:transcription factor Ouib [Drosophila santomea]
MKEFCRTCGQTVVAEQCLQIFSPQGRKLLQCVRSITNCWLQNVQDLPNHICMDCQLLLKQVQKFRRRCAKIEKYFARRRRRMNLGEAPAAMEQLPVQQAAAPDPLGIDELMATSEIKIEPTQLQMDEDPQTLYPENQLEQSLSYENGPGEDFLPLPEDYGEVQTEVAATTATSTTNEPPQRRIKNSAKIKSKKHTMRMGRKLIHVKVIDDKQPKRIVDRNGPSAKPCICEHCGRQFKDTSNLHVHLLRHTGTKPFECEQCHQKCYTLHLLRRHQLKHTEGPYACTFCGLEYSTNSSRVRHEREACKKGRAPQSKWEIIKKGERTFHCEVCDLWFLRAGNFTQHINSSSHIENERRKKRKSNSVHPAAINS